MTETRRVDYPFPLRPDFKAQLILPPDLTKREVERLTAWLETLIDPSQTEEQGTTP